MSSRDGKPNKPSRKRTAGDGRARGGAKGSGGKRSGGAAKRGEARGAGGAAKRGDARRTVGTGKGGNPRSSGSDASRTGGRSGGSRRSGTGSKSGSVRRSGSGRQQTDRDAPAQKKLPAAASGLPRHVVEALIRVTPPARQSAALSALAEAAEAFSEGQFHVAARKAGHAKDLSSRDATIREILALASYRIGDWQTALRELRTYRRLSGETTHMPVEMDVLRALGRGKDVAAVWE